MSIICGSESANDAVRILHHASITGVWYCSYSFPRSSKICGNVSAVLLRPTYSNSAASHAAVHRLNVLPGAQHQSFSRVTLTVRNSAVCSASAAKKLKTVLICSHNEDRNSQSDIALSVHKCIDLLGYVIISAHLRCEK